jgi:hypothetical protein
MKKFIKKIFSKGNRGNTVISPEASVIVAFDDEKISCQKPNSNIEIMPWAKLDAVVIETTDEGPFKSDVFWLLLTKDMSCGCIIPQGATGDKELLNELQNRLPDFDNRMVIEAMGSTQNQRFLVWERDGS